MSQHATTSAGPRPDFEVRVDPDGDATVVAPHGELDIHTAPELRRAMAGLGDEPGDVVLDLAGTRFMDSSGLGAILAASELVSAGGGRFVLAGARPNVARVLALTHVDRRLTVAEDVAGAQDALDRA